MTADRLLMIKLLLNHPAGVGPKWQANLLKELYDAIVVEEEVELMEKK